MKQTVSSVIVAAALGLGACGDDAGAGGTPGEGEATDTLEAEASETTLGDSATEDVGPEPPDAESTNETGEDTTVVEDTAVAGDGANDPDDSDVQDTVDVCQPDCSAAQCGPDGCGGVCGTCGDDHACEAGACVPTCSDSQLACHGACFGQSSFYAQICGSTCCDDGELDAPFALDELPAGFTYAYFFSVESRARVSARVAFDDGSCPGWNADLGPNDEVRMRIEHLDNILYEPQAEATRAMAGGSWCFQLDAELPPGVYGVLIEARENHALGAFHGELSTSPAEPVASEPVTETGRYELGPDAQALTLELDTPSRVFVGATSGDKCAEGALRLRGGEGETLSTTPVMRCASANYVLGPGAYGVDTFASHSQTYDAAYVVVEPLSVTETAIAPGETRSLGTIADGGLAHATTPELLPGTYRFGARDCVLESNVAGVAASRSLLMLDMQTGYRCPSRNLVVDEAVSYDLYVYGDRLAGQEGVALALGLREFSGSTVDSDGMISREAGNISYRNDNYTVIIANGGTLSISAQSQCSSCSCGGPAILNMDLKQDDLTIASSPGSHCSQLSHEVSPGVYTLRVRHKNLDDYTVTFDLP